MFMHATRNFPLKINGDIGIIGDDGRKSKIPEIKTGVLGLR